MTTIIGTTHTHDTMTTGMTIHTTGIKNLGIPQVGAIPHIANPSNNNNKKETKMADVDTSMLAGQHGDIRREAAQYAADIRYNVAERAGDIRREGAEHANEIVKEGIKTGFDVRGDVKDARFDVSERVGNQGDRIVDRVEESKDALMARTWDMGRDTQDIRAQIVAQQQQMVAGFHGAAKDAEINALKTQMELAKQTTYLSDKIDNQSERTRELINDLKYHDLNRGLVERNAALVELEHDRHHWRHRAEQSQYQSQWAQLQSQVQAFQSQLQETRQGMVNFGTMAGVGQSSTSNNVR